MIAPKLGVIDEECDNRIEDLDGIQESSDDDSGAGSDDGDNPSGSDQSKVTDWLDKSNNSGKTKKIIMLIIKKIWIILLDYLKDFI